MTAGARARRLGARVALWADQLGLGAEVGASLIDREWPTGAGGDPCRPPADPRAIAAWEARHGFRLPRGLRAWLALSDGLYRDDNPVIHPLSAIGPMVPFAKVPGLMIQPESWFELGNPGIETICVDLAYRWSSGDYPLFTSGDDLRRSRPRLIAPSFESWLLRLLREGGREYWLDPDFPALGDPWAEHRRRVPAPTLPERLRHFAPRVRLLMRLEANDSQIAAALGISSGDVEMILRHLQHAG
jgi:hypothetical protein